MGNVSSDMKYAFQTYDYLPARGSAGFVRAASASKGLLYYEDSDAEVKRKINTQIYGVPSREAEIS